MNDLSTIPVSANISLLPAQRWLGRLPADTGHLTFFAW